MPDEDEMLRDLTSNAALPMLAAALLCPNAPRTCGTVIGPIDVHSQMLVQTAWLEDHLHESDLIVLQIGRDRAQYDSGHIPGSRFLSLDELVEQRADSLNELPPVAELADTFASLGIQDSSRVILVDEAGGVLAARAYFTLDYLGHGDQAALLDGGLKNWRRESRPISEDQPRIDRGDFHPHIRPEILINTPQMNHLSRIATEKNSGSDSVLLDARPMAEHTGAVYSDSISQAGHIAGSQSLYWKNLIHSEADPELLDPGELQQQFENAGALPQKLVVTYCRTGMQSSFTYFVAKYLGYRTAMYDGSVYEWVRSSGGSLVTSPEASRATPIHP